MNIPNTVAGRLRVSRSSYVAELTRIEEQIMSNRLRAQRDRQNRKPTSQKSTEKPEKLAALVKARSELLRCIFERDEYIVRAFENGIPARFRGDLHETTEERARVRHKSA